MMTYAPSTTLPYGNEPSQDLPMLVSRKKKHGISLPPLL